MLTGYEKLVLG